MIFKDMQIDPQKCSNSRLQNIMGFIGVISNMPEIKVRCIHTTINISSLGVEEFPVLFILYVIEFFRFSIVNRF